MIKRIDIKFLEDYKNNIKKSINNNGEEATKASIRQDLSNPEYIALFAYLILPHYFYRSFKDVHYQLLEHIEIGKRNKSNKATKAYRGMGKSSIQLVLANVYEICYKIHPYIVINSYNDTMSIDKLKSIKDEFDDNEVIHWLFGNPILDRDSWNKSDITVFGNVRVKTISTGQNPRGLLDRGSRPTKIISDDIMDDKDVLSGDMRQKSLDWYNKALTPALAEDGVMEILNTPLHPEDIIETIFKQQPPFHNWDTLKIKAMEDGNSVDPDWKTTQQLNEMAKDEYTFSQEYLCEPLLITSGLIKYDWLKFWTSQIDSNNEKTLSKVDKLYLHADTTHTGKQTSDYFCLGAVGEGKDKDYYLVDYVLEKLDVESQARATIQFYQKLISQNYSIQKFTYDEKANQGFGYWIKKLAKDEYGISLPIEELKYSQDKISHFETHKPHFIANRVVFPKYNKNSKTALDQLLAFPQKGVHDDFVDMLSGCLDNFKNDKNKTTVGIFF